MLLTILYVMAGRCDLSAHGMLTRHPGSPLLCGKNKSDSPQNSGRTQQEPKRNTLSEENDTSHSRNDRNGQLYGRCSSRLQAGQCSIPDRITNAGGQAAGNNRIQDSCYVQRGPGSGSIQKYGKGTARRKFPAVAPVGLPEPFPRSEYIPQATPAASITAELTGGGADSLGSRRATSPEHAAERPTVCIIPILSPLQRP
jgi:hypothetical protein